MMNTVVAHCPVQTHSVQCTESPSSVKGKISCLCLWRSVAKGFFAAHGPFWLFQHETNLSNCNACDEAVPKNCFLKTPASRLLRKLRILSFCFLVSVLDICSSYAWVEGRTVHWGCVVPRLLGRCGVKIWFHVPLFERFPVFSSFSIHLAMHSHSGSNLKLSANMFLFGSCANH